MKHRLITALALFTTAGVHAADTGLTLEKNGHGISVTVNGKPFARYAIDQANKPYL
jgi:hypothetical protein